MKRILIIKLSALGDFIQATAPMKAIRDHHKDDHITLLTTKGMLPLAETCPWFDSISVDHRKGIWNIPYVLDMRRKLKGFDMVYDLQTNDRSSIYHLIAGRPNWNGIAPGCTDKHTNPERDNLHSYERFVDQLKTSGIEYNNLPDLSYAAEDVSDILKKNSLKKGEYTVLIPGAAPTRPAKKWPHYQELAQELINKGEKVVLVGGPAEADILSEIEKNVDVVNLGGKTSLTQLIGVLLSAKQFIGNDTGPSHMAAACGLKGIVIFGHDSDPKLHAPRGKDIQVLHATNIADVSTQSVLEAI